MAARLVHKKPKAHKKPKLRLIVPSGFGWGDGSSVLDSLSQASQKGQLATEIWKRIGDLSKHKVTKNYVLIALYIGGRKFAGTDIDRPDQNIKEDIWQSNVGLLLKCGPTAFKHADVTDEPERPVIGDWVMFNAGDKQRIQINQINCAWLHEDNVKGTLPDPSTITHRQ